LLTEVDPAPASESSPACSTALKVGGLTPFTATDYPGKLAAVVYVQGCPWRCGYCHNPHLQTRTVSSPLDWAQLLARLQRRVGLVDAVVFSGGEPCIDPALEQAMVQVRALGFGVGLHTAGAYPRRLAQVLPLVDWVAMDVKTSFQSYEAITRMADSGRQAQASAQAVLASGVAHEFRTTVHPGLHTEPEILALAQGLSAMGVQNYALQVFRSTGCADENLNAQSTAGYPGAALAAQVSGLFASFSLRRA
jgi:anaerobic ribonucleoside-triphosphate reductase activating protein